ncbi:hypothetical protein GCM10028799_12240 [Kribbella italica]
MHAEHRPGAHATARVRYWPQPGVRAAARINKYRPPMGSGAGVSAPTCEFRSRPGVRAAGRVSRCRPSMGSGVDVSAPADKYRPPTGWADGLWLRADSRRYTR